MNFVNIIYAAKIKILVCESIFDIQ
jgi:hypothetical protein